jgi:hypothetical protein
MNNTEVTMHKPPTGTGFDALDKAIEGAQIAVSLALRTRGPLALTGACRARHCAGNDLPASRLAPHNADAGQPPRHTVPVRLSTLRGRPPASHRRGRSPLPSPSRDRADGATLSRRDRRPALRDAQATDDPEETGSTTTESPTLPRRRWTFTSESSVSLTPRNAIRQPPP